MFKKGIIVLTLLSILGVGFIAPKNSFAAYGDYLNYFFTTTSSDGCTGLPISISFYNDIFWIGCPDPAIHKFSSSGTYIGNANFDLAGSGNTGVQGLLYYQGYFWISDDNNNMIYKYNSDGTYTGTSFSTAGSGATNIDGIAGYNNFLWIVDYTDDEVYKYNLDGTYASSSFDIGFSGNNQPGGIVVLDGDFLIIDATDNLIYRYDDTGALVTSYSTGVNGHTGLTSITTDDESIWLVDLEPNEVYKYEGIDLTAPTMDTLSPADNAVDVAVLTNQLTMTFDESVVVGSGYVTIYNALDDSIFETLDVTNLDQVEADGVDVYLYLSLPLVGDSDYYVKVDATAFDDTSGNSFAGISNETTWNFTTYDNVSPMVSIFSPADNEQDVNINSDLVITFNEDVDVDVDYITLYKTLNDTLVEQIDASDVSKVEVNGSVVNVTLVNELDYSTEYYVEIGADTFFDVNDNYFTGIADTTTWNFTTESRSSSGSVRNNVVKVVPPIIVLPSNSPLPCTSGALFSNLTGLPCLPVQTGSTNITTPNEFKFLINLGSGFIHSDVKELQKYLNTHGYPVALSGPGSLGNETTKFGKLTREALIKFQLANNITPAIGFFGPITRAVVN